MNVLFICTGNTCRSPMAEVIFNETFKKARATSRGLHIQQGSTMTSKVQLILNREYGFYENREAEQLQELDITSADVIITMTETQKREVKRRYGGERVYSLKEMAGEKGDIVDPYGMDDETYTKTFREIRELVQRISEFEQYRR